MDCYGRTVALCLADGVDLGAAMVSAGMAWAFTRYSSDYVSQERTAIAARPGARAREALGLAKQGRPLTEMSCSRARKAHTNRLTPDSIRNRLTAKANWRSFRRRKNAMPSVEPTIIAGT